MTRKSAKYIGRQCLKHSNELQQKAKWLTKKISRKLYDNSYMRVYDSYYDMQGLYLVFEAFDVVTFPHKPPETRMVDILGMSHEVSEAAMVDRSDLKVILNSTWKGNECFIIHIPFKAYEVYNLMSDFQFNIHVDVE